MHAHEIDPPALRYGILAVHELAEAGADEDPAGAVGRAGLAAGAVPGGVEQRPLHQRHGDAPDDIKADQRDRGIDRRGEQAAAQAFEPDRLHRTTSLWRALYQFMKSETARLSTR